MNIEIAPKSTETILNWEDAILYCQLLDYNGSGWRLPNRDELNWMWVNRTDDMQYNRKWSGPTYWTSTEFDGDNTWLQDFTTGDQYPGWKTFNYYVRAIRDKS